MRLLTKVAVILLSVWTILAALLWALVSSVDEALLGRSPSLEDTLKFSDIPAVGWIFVIAVWVIKDKPWRNRYLSDDEEDGVWVGSTYMPKRKDNG